MANGTGANLGFEDKLWAAADKLRGTMDAAEYKHVVLGLIFLKYISDAFMEMHDRLAVDDYAEAEDRDEYLAENVFWVPPEARWPYLQKSAKQASIGQLVDDAMKAMSATTSSSRASCPGLRTDRRWTNTRLGELIDLIATIGWATREPKKDILVRSTSIFLAPVR